MFVLGQILGMVLIAASAQGLVRQLIDHASTGLLGWLPVEFGGRVAVYAVVLVLGVLLTGWAHSRAKADPTVRTFAVRRAPRRSR